MTRPDDILDRMKRLTAQMDDREMALWRIFSNTDDLICVLDGDQDDPGNGKVLLISPSFERMLGWTEEMLLGKRWAKFIHQEDLAEQRAKDPDHCRSNWEHGICKCRVRVMNSTCEDYRWYEWSCARQADTGIWYCIGRDITELVETQEILDAALHRVSSLIEGAVDGIITIDEQSLLIEPMNAAASEMFGYEKEELLGKTIEVLMPEPERSMHQKAIDGYVATGNTTVIGQTREVRGLHKDGTTFPIEIGVSESTVHDRRYFHGIIRDLRKVRR